MSGLATAGALVRLIGLKGTISGFLKAVPWQVYAGLAVIALLLLGWHAHGVAMKRATDAAFNAGFNREWQRHQADIASWRKASAEAAARNRAEVQRIEADAKSITETQNAQIETDAARYRSLAAAYARLHPAPAGAGTAAAGGAAGKGGLPGASPGAGQPEGDPALAVVPAADLDRCATLYTIAKGWQDWWAAEEAKWPKSGG